jgi:3,4-dihydroxy 2-butanone 4-phosphate synthase/GTP cyclohydrolase II
MTEQSRQPAPPEAGGRREPQHGGVRLDPVERAIADIAAGKAVVVVDDEGRENEGDIIFAAAKATPELMAFTIRHSSGVICVPMPGHMLDRLEIPLMTPHNRDKLRTAYTISVDARDGVSTGISAADRAHTARVLADSATEPWELTRPGHVFPLRYREGGVLVRRGHTEAAVDLARLAGLTPAGVLVEVVNDDGTMKRAGELREFADEHGLAMISIEDLVRYRRRTEVLVERRAETRLPTRYGDFTAYGYVVTVDGSEHVALVYGDVSGAGSDAGPVLTRVHSECLTGDVFGSQRCDCGPQLGRRWTPSSARVVAWWSTCAGTRAAASGWSPSCRPTSCRTAVATPSTPIWSSACPPMPGTTAPPPRSCATSASRWCGC